MVIPDVRLLAVAPMIILLFLKSPEQRASTMREANTCPRCQDVSRRSSRFCTNCGWELALRYPAESAAEPDQPSRGPAEETGPAAKVSDAVQREPASEEPSELAEEPAAEALPPDLPTPPKPVPVGSPTASGMTERGVRLYNQGRIQESIDQFTKAIALDPTYGQAFARRAEAYARLGRGEEAAEDRRRMDALNATSSGN